MSQAPKPATTRLAELEVALSQLNNRMQAVEKCCEGKETLSGSVKDLQETQSVIRRLVLGDEELGVTPLRKEVAELSLWKKRFEWTVYVLSVISGGSLISAIKLLLFP